MILFSDVQENQSGGLVEAQFHNVDGFRSEYCIVILYDTDQDTYWDKFTIQNLDDNCYKYEGKSGPIVYDFQ